MLRDEDNMYLKFTVLGINFGDPKKGEGMLESADSRES
jgi:hypothetical protein